MRPYGEVKNTSKKYQTNVFHSLFSVFGPVNPRVVMIVC